MTTRGTALGALCALLDRSLVQIAEASADARTYDQQTIYEVSDVWDNNTFPLFHAATALTSTGRERRARAALAWMADLGPGRRSWMLEQADATGHALERILPPPAARPLYARDFLGRVRPPFMRLTAEAALELGTDYDLAATEVRTLSLERAGTRLTGSLVLVVPRRYDGGPRAGEPAALHLSVKDVTGIRFDSDDRMGVALEHGAEGMVVGLGAGGSLRAASGTVHLDDPAWHLSAAGRAADRRTPPREERPRRTSERRRRHPEGAALVAATILQSAMLEIRMVRCAHLADRIPVRPLAGALFGAGTGILAAGARRGGRREHAFHELINAWITDTGPVLTPLVADRLRHLADTTRLPDSSRAWIAEVTGREAAHPPPATEPVPDLPSEAELRFVQYTAAHERHGSAQDSSAVLNLALPAGSPDAPNRPWRLRALEVGDVGRFRLWTDAFDGPLGLRTAGAAKAIESLIIGDDALNVHGSEAGP
ncbi:hypothetical protein [Microtetraspora niveoalba]|uniref:hypothetical protein n=1 Tax=Microtetraspora niveoalba TaxID=46175 RepID=UPI000AAECC99|nr:hypothetical protein [Microtetraspora niveoalba]